MFDIFRLMLAWLPTPLNILAFGLVCLLLVVVGLKVLRIIVEFIPFF